MIGSVHLQLKSSRLGAGGGWAAGVTQRQGFRTHAQHYSCWTPTGVWVQSGWRRPVSRLADQHITLRETMARNYFLSVSLIFKEGVVNISLSVYHDADVFVR